MKVLHLFSNSKWTGPAEPALSLCAALRRSGIDADFACPQKSKAPRNMVVENARSRGIDPILQFRLNKHRNPLDNARDRRALRTFLREARYDLVHCHLDNDHRIASRAATAAGIPVVRSSYEGAGLEPWRLHANVLRRTAWLIQPSSLALEHDAGLYGFPRARMQVVEGAVDVQRFDPARSVPDARGRLGIPSDAFVVGIVARMQVHRRFEDFWEAIRRLVEVAAREVHIVVIGRGTRQEEVGMVPVRRLGLESRVHFTGFVEGEDYVSALKSIDIKTYLVPGSDGTCRAVREALAMGKPAVVSNRGMLPEIVQDGRTGLVCDGSPEALARCFVQLCENSTLRTQLGRTAREYAEAHFSLDKQACEVAGIYEQILRGF